VKTIKLWGIACTFVLAATVGLFAATYENFWATIGGNNNPAQDHLGVWGDGTIGASFAWDGGGPTYIKVRVVGFNNPTCSGSRDGEYCTDVAHPGVVGWSSFAGIGVNFVPIGCYEVSADGWVSNEYQGQRGAVRCFDWPPNLAGDGYCVDYYYDGGGGGIRNAQYNEWACDESPIIIATGKDRSYRLSTSPVLFDINADGSKEYIYWTRGDSGDAFLAIDRNGNGRIDDGSELFGSATVPGVHNGFEALRQLAGGIEAGDVNAVNSPELFSKLLLWTDVNHDGESQPDELQPASNVLEAVGLGYTTEKRRDGNGNVFGYKGWVRFADSYVSSDILVWGNSSTGRRNQAKREINIYDVIFALAK